MARSRALVPLYELLNTHRQSCSYLRVAVRHYRWRRSDATQKVRGGFMKRFLSCLCVGLFTTAISVESSFAQRALTWQEVRDKFEAANPTFRPAQIGIADSNAQ